MRRTLALPLDHACACGFEFTAGLQRARVSDGAELQRRASAAGRATHTHTPGASLFCVTSPHSHLPTFNRLCSALAPRCTLPCYVSLLHFSLAAVPSPSDFSLLSPSCWLVCAAGVQRRGVLPSGPGPVLVLRGLRGAQLRPAHVPRGRQQARVLGTRPLPAHEREHALPNRLLRS